MLESPINPDKEAIGCQAQSHHQKTFFILRSHYAWAYVMGSDLSVNVYVCVCVCVCVQCMCVCQALDAYV